MNILINSELTRKPERKTSFFFFFNQKNLNSWVCLCWARTKDTQSLSWEQAVSEHRARGVWDWQEGLTGGEEGAADLARSPPAPTTPSMTPLFRILLCVVCLKVRIQKTSRSRNPCHLILEQGFSPYLSILCQGCIGVFSRPAPLWGGGEGSSQPPPSRADVPVGHMCDTQREGCRGDGKSRGRKNRVWAGRSHYFSQGGQAGP